MKHILLVQIIIFFILTTIFSESDAIKLEKVYKKKRKPSCKEDIDRIEKNYNSQLQILDDKIELKVGDIVHCEVIVENIDISDSKSSKNFEIKVVNTPDNVQFQYFPSKSEINCFVFQVRASNDAYISLGSKPMNSEHNYEFVIGTTADFQRIALKKNGTELIGKDVSPNLLDVDEYHGFWINWYNGVLAIGRQGENDSLIDFKDINLNPVNFIGVRTINGSNGVWIIEEPKCPTGKEKDVKIKRKFLGTKCWTPDVTEDNLSWSDES